MTDFSLRGGDPVAAWRRISDMLTGCGSLENPDAKLALRGYAGRETALTRSNGWASAAVTGSTEDNWAELLLRVRDAQDETAFAALFSHFAPRIKGFLMRSGSTEAMAEEVAQEVMVTVWHKARLFDPMRAGAATWIFSIARNRRIDVLRKQRRPEPEDLGWGPEPETDQAAAMMLQQESEKLAEALRALPSNQRELIERAYFGELSHSEIAAETGLPLGTIKSRIRLALDRLRRAMS